MATLPPETPIASRPSPLHLVFYNARGLRAGWRLLIFVLLLSILTLVAGQIARNVGLQPGSRPPSGFLFPLVLALSELVPFLVLLFLCWIMSRIERRGIGAYGLPLEKSALPRFWIGYVLWGFVPLSILLLIMRALHVFYFGDLALHGGQILAWALLWGFMFLMVGLLEEFLFRGYVLYTLADGIGFWPAAVILAVLFSFAHMGNTGETITGIIATGCFALFAAATLWRTGDLWLAVGAHAGWDWGQSFFYGVNDSGVHAPGHLLNSHQAGPVWLSGGSVGPEGSVLTLVLWVAMFVMFLVIYRKRRQTEPAPLTEQPTTGFVEKT